MRKPIRSEGSKTFLEEGPTPEEPNGVVDVAQRLERRGVPSEVAGSNPAVDCMDEKEAAALRMLVAESIHEKRESQRKVSELRDLLARWLRLPPGRPRRRQELYEATERALK